MDPSLDEYMNEWEEWQSEERKKERRQPVKESHEQSVEELISIGEGGADFLQRVTMPTLWRGGTQILGEERGDAELLNKK